MRTRKFAFEINWPLAETDEARNTDADKWQPNQSFVSSTVNMEVLHSQSTINCRCLAYYKSSIDVFYRKKS